MIDSESDSSLNEAIADLSVEDLQASGPWRRNRALNRVADHLRTRPTFAGCSREDVVALIRAGVPTVVPDHWAFLHEGTPADAAYLLLSGGARVYRDRVPVAEVRSGDVVGETALIHGALRNATVSSFAPLKAIRLENAPFRALVEHRPNVRSALTEIANARRRTA